MGGCVRECSQFLGGNHTLLRWVKGNSPMFNMLFKLMWLLCVCFTIRLLHANEPDRCSDNWVFQKKKEKVLTYIKRVGFKFLYTPSSDSAFPRKKEKKALPSLDNIFFSLHPVAIEISPDRKSASCPCKREYLFGLVDKSLTWTKPKAAKVSDLSQKL